MSKIEFSDTDKVTGKYFKAMSKALEELGNITEPIKSDLLEDMIRQDIGELVEVYLELGIVEMMLVEILESQKLSVFRTFLDNDKEVI